MRLRRVVLVYCGGRRVISRIYEARAAATPEGLV